MARSAVNLPCRRRLCLDITFSRTPPLEFYFSFQVAEYRKPEINLSAEFPAEEIKLGDSAEAEVDARYFFDAPAGDVDVNWALYAKPDFFSPAWL